MATSIFWEDIIEATALPPSVKIATARQLVQYAGASLDFYEIHYDKDFAVASGLPGVVVHGALKSAWLAQMVMDWAGPLAVLRAVRVRYRDTDVPGDPLTCRGRVTKKYREGDRLLVEIEVWLENGKGVRTTEGSIITELPLRQDATLTANR